MIKRAAAVMALLGLGACHPAQIGRGRNGADHAETVTSRLACRSQQGALTRTDASADGRTCRYVGDDGRVVELRYLALDGRDATAALQDVERDLRTRLRAGARMTPGATRGATPQAEPSNRDDDADDEDNDTAGQDGKGGAEAAASDGKTHRSGDDRVSINLPGVHIEANDGGAHIRAFGQTIDAKEGGGAVVVGQWNGAANEIHANDDGAEMRFGFAGRQAVDMTFILTSSRSLPSGVRLVGYVARGPTRGPLVLATVVAPTERAHDERTDLKDVAALVAGNVVK